MLAWSTAGNCGFKGSRKSTPFAATTAAEKVVKQIIENNNAQEAGIYVKGPGPGRDAAAREVASKLKKVKFITDNTPLPLNGCRKKKRRRV